MMERAEKSPCKAPARLDCGLYSVSLSDTLAKPLNAFTKSSTAERTASALLLTVTATGLWVVLRRVSSTPSTTFSTVLPALVKLRPLTLKRASCPCALWLRLAARVLKARRDKPWVSVSLPSRSET